MSEGWILFHQLAQAGRELGFGHCDSWATTASPTIGIGHRHTSESARRRGGIVRSVSERRESIDLSAAPRHVCATIALGSG
jgi:hypothetical protein